MVVIRGAHPVIDAVACRSLRILKNVVDAGGNVNESDSQRLLTPLLLAVELEWEAGVVFLLSRGADPSHINAKGWTVLHLACVLGSPCSTITLLINKETFHQRDRTGQTALMKASRLGRADVVRLLLDCGARIRDMDRTGRDAVVHGAQHPKVIVMFGKN